MDQGNGVDVSDVSASAAEPSRRTPTGDVERALVDAAVTVLERDGFAALTVRAVAKEAGVAPMGVYNHLGGKDGLVAAVLIRGFQGLRDAVESNAGLPPDQRMRATGHSYREFALSRPATYSLMFGGGVAPEVYEPVAEHGRAAFEALVKAVLDAQQAGLVVPDDPVDVAMRIWSAVHGAMSLTIAGSGPPPDPSADTDPPTDPSAKHKNGVSDSTYERLLDMIEKGLLP
jgi:AcrR family transcriptional regulator